MTWTIAPFSTNRLLKREVGHWQKRSCVMGVICQLLQTISSGTCRNRRVCKICKQKHPTGLYDVHQREYLGASSVLVVSNFAEMDMKCASTGIPAKIISMCVVPVKIGHVVTQKEVSTLAMLDNCSQGTFMKESIKEKLGISGRKTEITI